LDVDPSAPIKAPPFLFSQNLDRGENGSHHPLQFTAESETSATRWNAWHEYWL
jgi:hypothetical protein